MKFLTNSFRVFILLTVCCVSAISAQSFRSLSLLVISDCAQQQKVDNEFVNTAPSIGYFYCNPLRLNDGTFNSNALTLETTGELKLIKGAPETGKLVEIPFYLHLRRNGKLVDRLCGENESFSKAEISTILKVAQDGDELIIEPVNKEDWPAKRIVKIGDKC